MNLPAFKPRSRSKQILYRLPGCPGKDSLWCRRACLFLGLFAAFLLVFVFPAKISIAAATGPMPDTGISFEVSALQAGAFAGELAASTELAEQAGEPEPAEGVLTYEEAVELALKHSTELKNAREGIFQAQEMREMLANLRRIAGFTPVGYGYDLADAADRELLLNFTAADTGWRLAAKQAEALEETIAFQVRSAYDEVLQNTAGLEKADRALGFAMKKLIQTETKTRLGAESNFNRENTRNSYAADKEQRDGLARQLDEAYLSLNKLLGLEPGARPLLQEPGPPAWLELEEAGLESRISLILHDHPYIWLQEQKIAQAERELSLYTYNVGAPNYKVVASTVQQEKNNLYALKEEVRKGVRSLYYQLQGLESQYKVLATHLAQAESGLRVTQLRCKLGMVVPLEVEQAELALLEIQSGMQDLARAYGQLKLLFEKPWLVPVSFNDVPA